MFSKLFLPSLGSEACVKIQWLTYNEGRAKQPHFRVIEFCAWLQVLTSLLYQDLCSWRSLQMLLKNTWGSFFRQPAQLGGYPESMGKHSYFDQWTDCSESAHGCSSKTV